MDGVLNVEPDIKGLLLQRVEKDTQLGVSNVWRKKYERRFFRISGNRGPRRKGNCVLPSPKSGN